MIGAERGKILTTLLGPTEARRRKTEASSFIKWNRKDGAIIK
jgi:hypothetical protein